jgi:organic hydroperoxide reductase OsmC/OhrA
LAAQSRLRPSAYESEAQGLLEDINGKYSFTEVTVRPRITVNGKAEIERAREIMEIAEAHCFISNSVKAKVKVVAQLVVILAGNR